MRPTTLKSKRDKYNVLAVEISDTGFGSRFDMELEHIPTKIKTTGVLIINHTDLPGKLKRTSEESELSQRVAEELSKALLLDDSATLNINQFIEDTCNYYAPKGKGVQSSIQKEVSIDKSSHRNFTKGCQSLAVGLITTYSKIIKVKVDGNTRHIYIEAEVDANKTYIDEVINFIKVLFDYETVTSTVTYSKRPTKWSSKKTV